jgi:hypothetical protein
MNQSRKHLYVRHEYLKRQDPEFSLLRTCKDDVEWCPLPNATLFYKCPPVGIHQLVDQQFFRRRIHLGVSLGNHVQWQRSIAILDGSCLGSNVENLLNDARSCHSVALARNGLMKNRRGDVIVHDHACDGNQMIVSDAVQDRVPLVLTAHRKDGMHFVAVGSTEGRNDVRHGGGGSDRSRRRMRHRGERGSGMCRSDAKNMRCGSSTARNQRDEELHDFVRNNPFQKRKYWSHDDSSKIQRVEFLLIRNIQKKIIY